MNGKIIRLYEVDTVDDPVSEVITALGQLSFPALILVLLVLARRDGLSPMARIWILRLIERVLTRSTSKAA
jgi:hypothetical protein